MNPDPHRMPLLYFFESPKYIMRFLVTNEFGSTEEIYKSSQIVFSYLMAKCDVRMQ